MTVRFRLKGTQSIAHAADRRRIIINADGYGFTPGVNQGIERTLEAGLVRSISCTPNFGYLGDVASVARRFPHVSFGIHFNLSVGQPVAAPEWVPSLLGPNGRFHGRHLLRELLLGRIAYDHMVRELSCQAALLADAGVPMTHFDGHQNKHLYPGYYQACLEVGKRFGIRAVRTHRRLLYLSTGPIGLRHAVRYYVTHPARVVTHVGGRMRACEANAAGFVTADRLITPGYADSSHKSLGEFWMTLARTLPPGDSEVYCHPGIPDDILRANAAYVEERAIELAVLTDATVRQAYREAGVEVISFHELIVSERR